MYFDRDVYSIENLKTKDKKDVELAEQVKLSCLTDKSVDDFIEAKEITGETLQNIYHDALSDFVSFLQEQVEYFKADLIIAAIDSYDEVELEALREAAKKNTKKSTN